MFLLPSKHWRESWTIKNNEVLITNVDTLKKDHQLEILKKDHEIELLKRDHDIELLKKDIDLLKKDNEILNFKLQLANK